MFLLGSSSKSSTNAGSDENPDEPSSPANASPSNASSTNASPSNASPTNATSDPTTVIRSTEFILKPIQKQSAADYELPDYDENSRNSVGGNQTKNRSSSSGYYGDEERGDSGRDSDSLRDSSLRESGRDSYLDAGGARLRPMGTAMAPYVKRGMEMAKQGLGVLATVGDVVIEWCRDHPRFYSEFLKHRRHPKVKINGFLGMSMALFMLIWGLLGGNIAPKLALALALFLDFTINACSLILIERVSPRVLLVTLQNPLKILVAELRLWMEVLVNKYDVWPHFGDLDAIARD